MRKLTVTPDHVDDRGFIADLVVQPLDSVTIVYTHVGAIRGNHWHRQTWQWVYVVRGALHVVTRSAARGREADDLYTSELMVNPPGEEHAWKALEATWTVVCTRGPRSGPDYESDTHRLSDNERLIT